MTNSPLTPTSNTSDEALPAEASAEAKGTFQRLRQNKLSWPVWLAIAYAGLVLPVLCHGATWSNAADPPQWQSGDLHDQLGYVLSGSAGFVLYPLMLYPMVCLLLLLFREERFARGLVVRFGIFTGVPVSAWYCIVLGIVIFDVPRLLSLEMLPVLTSWGFGSITPFLLWGVLRLLLWLRSKLGVSWSFVAVVGGLAILSALVLFHVTIVMEGEGNYVELGAFAVFVSMIFGPHWCFDAYLAMSLRLVWRYPQRVRFTILQLMGAMSWLAAFLSACRWAVLLSLEEYAKLPLEPPSNCYIATAASRGHARFVGSRVIRSRTGAEWRINRQLTVFKAAEIALRTLAPRLHARIRAVYDRLGPAVARRLTHPLLGDLAYLVLKPVEWTSEALLACLLGRERRRIDRLYFREASLPTSSRPQGR